MARLGLCWLFLALCEVILGAAASTHWFVTDHGRIQSRQVNTEMPRPYDLLAFLEHSLRFDSVNKLLETMKTRKMRINKQLLSLVSALDVENYLQMTDSDCLLAEQHDIEVDYLQSVIIDVGLQDGLKEVQTHEKYDPKSLEKKLIPDCKKAFPLDFSMHTFEHLSGMRNRKNLIQRQEISLMKIVPPNMDLDTVAHMLAFGMQHNSSSWMYLNYASIYWRIKGDAYNAMECARRAIVKSPRTFRHIPLLTAGGILHASNHSVEAATLLRAAIQYEPYESVNYFALANIYAHLGEFNRSIIYYDASLLLNPGLMVSRNAKHNILCDLKLEASLITLYNQLLHVFTELRAYHIEQTELLTFHVDMLWEHMEDTPFVASHSLVQDDNLNYFLSSHGQSCMQKGEDKSISCDILSVKEKLRVDLGLNLQILKNVEHQLTELRDRMEKSKLPSVLDHLTRTPDPAQFSTLFMDPTDKPKYSSVDILESTHPFEKPEWPTEAYCASLLPFVLDVKQYVPVYLPPENKGYVTYLFLSELIAIHPNAEHSLPWHPPICTPPKSYNRKYIPPELVKATTGYHLPDTSLTPLLTALVENADISEIGQRILTAINNKVAAPWVLSMLASLHWRVVGKPRNALDCLQHALDTVPSKFKDVPLISIASISHKFSLIDNALSVTEEAFKINPVEPMTNFLYGTLLHTKGNYSGAIHHLKLTLRVDLHTMNNRAMTMLQTIACQERFSTARPGQDTTWCIGVANLPDFATYKPREDESIMCDTNGKNCKRVHCFAVKASDTNLLTGV